MLIIRSIRQIKALHDVCLLSFHILEETLHASSFLIDFFGNFKVSAGCCWFLCNLISVHYFFKLIEAIFDGIELVLEDAFQFDLLALECFHSSKCLLGSQFVSIFFWVLRNI